MVVYILCYNYSAPEDVQQDQISYWLDFLQSTLPSSSQPTSKWQVLIVGTKSDQCNTKPGNIQLPISPAWKVLWPNLPLHSHQYIISSHQMVGVRAVVDKLEQICEEIFDKYSLLVPHEYNTLMDSIKAISTQHSIIPTRQLEAMCSWGNHYSFQLALKYFHAIGHIVLLPNGLACLCPQVEESDEGMVE
jgi:hypothetical protein